MPASAARIRANEKYNAKTYKQFNVKIKIADYDAIDNFCKKNNISKAQLITKAAKYCIENNIDLSDRSKAKMNV